MGGENRAIPALRAFSPLDSLNDRLVEETGEKRDIMAEQLADKIERLLAACRRVNAERGDRRRQAEALADENRRLREVIEHSHARIRELAAQLERLEEEAADTDREERPR
jgi:chromosome segregation ATPase